MAAKVPKHGLGGVRGAGGDVRVGADLAGDDGVDVGEANVVAVEAVCLVDDLEALVVGLDKGDVDALFTGYYISHMDPFSFRVTRTKKTHRKQRRAVHGELDDLDGGVVPRLHGGVGRQGDLGQADRPRVGVLGRPQDLEGRDHGEAHVPGPVVGPVGAEAHVDVEEGRGVALEPARLEGEGAARRGPVGAVCRRRVAAACVGDTLSAYYPFRARGFALAREARGFEPGPRARAAGMWVRIVGRGRTYMGTSIACRMGMSRWLSGCHPSILDM